MSDISSSPNQAAPILANRSARAQMRAQLRQDLLESRAGLRREREVSAAAAAVRAPRWRSARQLPASGTANVEAADGAHDEHEQPLAAQHPAEAMAATPEPDAGPEAVPDSSRHPSQPAASIFAGLMGDLALHQADASQQGAPDEVHNLADAAMPAPGIPEVSAVAAAAEPVQAPQTQAPATMITALGPGMLARLRLLGYGQIADLADADPVALRHGLGDISRLLNVEGWIAEAKRIARRDNSPAS